MAFGSLGKWFKKRLDDAGRIGDAIIPGNQSSWHTQSAPQRPQQRGGGQRIVQQAPQQQQQAPQAPSISVQPLHIPTLSIGTSAPPTPKPMSVGVAAPKPLAVGNQVIRQNPQAHTAPTGVIKQAQKAVRDFQLPQTPVNSIARDWVSRPAVEIAATATGKTFKPNNTIMRGIIGNDPVKPIQETVRGTYRAVKAGGQTLPGGIPIPQNMAGGFAAANAALHIANDAPIGGFIARGAIKGSGVAAKGIERFSNTGTGKQVINTLEKVPVGLSTKKVNGLPKSSQESIVPNPTQSTKLPPQAQPPQIKISKGSSQPSLEPIIPSNAVTTPQQGIQNTIRIADGKPPTMAEASLVGSAQKSEKIPEDIVSAIDPTRSVKTNTDTWNNAGRILYENGDDGALKYFQDNHGADANAVAWRLFEKRMANGDKQGAQELLADMTTRSIENGQASQAWAMIKRLDPKFIVAKLDRQVTKFAKEHSDRLKGRIDWTPEKQQRLMQQASQLGDDALHQKIANAKTPEEISTLTGITDKRIVKDLAKTTEPERIKGLLNTGLNKEINSIIPSTAGEKAMAYWKSGLLSAPVTHVRNIVGNAVNVASNMFETPLAGALDATVGRALTPTKRTVSMNPVIGMGKGLKAGKQEFGDAMKFGMTNEDAGKFNYKNTNWNENNPAEKYVLKPFSDTIYRTLGAEDKIYKAPATIHSLYNMAKAAAIDAGKVGDAKWMAEWVKNAPAAVKDAAKAEGRAWVFQKDTVVSAGMNALKQGIKRQYPGYEKIVDAIQPFVNVPAAIGSELITYTPAGSLRVLNKGRKALDKNIDLVTRDVYRRAAMKDLAKTSVGTGILAAGFTMGYNGDATGNMPAKNTKEYDQWVLENRQPNSIKVGGRWFNINSIGPQLALFNAAAQTGAQLRRDEAKGKTSSPIDKAIAFGGNVGTNFLNTSSLTGVTDATNAIKNPAQYAQNYVARQSTSFIPNIIKRGGAGFDPNQHDPQNFKESVLAQIPSARNNVTIKTDVAGNNVPNNQYGFLGIKALTDPFNISKDKSNGNSNISIGPSSSGKPSVDPKEQLYKEMSSKDERRFLAMSSDEQKKAANSSDSGYKMYQKMQNIKNKYKVDEVLPPGMSGGDAGVLHKVEHMSDQEKEDYFRKNKDAEYSYKVAQYERDKKLGKISTKDRISKDKEMKKLKIGTAFDKDTRDLFGLSKGDLASYLAEEEKGVDKKKLVDQIIAYDDALTKAGIQKKNKFRDKYGNIAIAPKETGSGRKGRKGGKNGVALPNFSVSSIKGSSVKIGHAKAPTGQLKKPGVIRVAKAKTGKIGGGKITIKPV